MSITRHFASEVLKQYLRGELYLSLHTGDPGETGANEVAGRAYRREACGDAFKESADGLFLNARELEFYDLPTCDVTHVGLWSGQRLIWSEQSESVRNVKSGDSIRFGEGKIGFSLI